LARNDQRIETPKRAGCPDPDQFAPDLEIGNLGNDDVDSPRQQAIEPEAALIAQGGPTSPARVAEWA
jgi:hypothetical protein